MEIPIPTLHLFPRLDELLIALLRSLSPADWKKNTLARTWTVKDIAGHLLDGNIRSLSIIRDGYLGDPPGTIGSYRDLVAYLNRLNADWVVASKRISPEMLIGLLECTGKEYYQMLKNLDPFADAAFAVLWAGEEVSKNWFHIAREYTEKWHHQQQIREATGKPGLMTAEFFPAMIGTFMHALPHTWRHTIAPEATLIKIIVTTALGGTWILEKHTTAWKLALEKGRTPDTEIVLDPETAWKLFTRALSPEKAKTRIIFKGNEVLGLPILDMVAVMA